MSILALVSCFITSAQACDFWRDEDGVWQVDCSFDKESYGKYLIDIRGRRSRAGYQLRLPNLQIRRFRYSSIGGGRDVEVFADVRNVGVVVSTAVTTVITFDVLDPLNRLAPINGSLRPVTVPAIGGNSEVRVSFGTISLPNRSQDWDVGVVGFVDPPTPAQPTRGNLIESNENDNAHMDVCRSYGPMPDVSGPHACL
ncbi:MAG: hypothetical protein H7Y02_06715 [Candidatus Obscuribacterales bacterium]|nr:hypothetical protein [Steroidobacteraceae bacterium]